MAAIPLTELTEGATALTGAGAFDELMKAFKAHLDAEFTAGRIKGIDYATVYLGGLQACMSQAVIFVLGKQQADKIAEDTVAAIALKNEQTLLFTQKTETEKAQTQDTVTAGAVAGAVGKQKELLDAQILGFDNDAKQKIMKIYADNYAIRRSTNSAETNPNGFDATDASSVIIKTVNDAFGAGTIS